MQLARQSGVSTREASRLMRDLEARLVWPPLHMLDTGSYLPPRYQPMLTDSSLHCGLAHKPTVGNACMPACIEHGTTLHFLVAQRRLLAEGVVTQIRPDGTKALVTIVLLSDCVLLAQPLSDSSRYTALVCVKVLVC